ncbi:hypothetical protein ACET3X_004331 [Alternaria dauci]|uniref:Uncharacterized protein n=1 Tax=Alternaria dauci TaxID=48095 RepID=A0ABR3UN13_9PLEO
MFAQQQPHRQRQFPSPCPPPQLSLQNLHPPSSRRNSIAQQLLVDQLLATDRTVYRNRVACLLLHELIQMQPTDHFDR